MPGAQKPPADPGLLGSSKRRDHYTSCHSSVLCHMVWGPSGHILWSSPGAPQVPGSSHHGQEQLG